MEPGEYEQLRELFARAGELDAQARAELLDEVRARSAELADELAALLEVGEDLRDSGAQRYLAEDAMELARARLEAVAAETLAVDWMPERIAGFRVLRRIGGGGMGVVFEAEQETPRRRVALKMMHPTLGSQERVRRFKLEAEVLGRLRHPCIAQIYECGACDLGRGAQPYIAMELVDGVDLASFVEREQLDVEAKLELVARVADAIQHAHERGVVHRDIKPDNVLVDAAGRPKVLDFGVARASETSMAISSLVTQTGELIGTLAYMAPEQLSGKSGVVSAKSDVYALGVILYQLLSGRLPHEIVGLPITAALEILSRSEPERLSKIDARLRGDVETIVAKAMEKDPERRYTSAAAFAADIRRRLQHLPIAARPPSLAYRVSRSLRRNRSLALGASAVLLTLVSGLVATAWQARLASEQRDRARESTEAQRRLSESESQARREAERRGEEARSAEYAATRQSYATTLLSACAQLARMQPIATLGSLNAAPLEHRGWEWNALRARLESSLERFDALEPLNAQLLARGPGSEPKLVAAPGGEWFLAVTPHAQRPVRRRDARTGAMLGEPFGPPSMKALAARPVLSRDGDVLALLHNVAPLEARLEHWSVSEQRQLRAWSVPLEESKELIGSYHRDGLWCVIRPDQSGVLIIGPHSLALWEADAQAVTVRCETEACGYLVHEFSPDGRFVVATENDVDAWLLDARTLERVGRVHADANSASCMAFSPDSARLALGCLDRCVYVWDLGARPLRRASVLRLHDAPAHVVCSPDGRLVTTLDDWGRLQCFDANTGELVGAALVERMVAESGASLSADRVAVVDTDGAVRVWSAEERQTVVLRGHRSFVYDVAPLSSLGLIASVGWDGWRGQRGALRLWDAETGEELAALFGPGWMGMESTVAACAPRMAILAERLEDDRPGQHWIYVLDARDGWLRRMEAQRPEEGFALDPSGERLVVLRTGEGRSRLVEYDAATLAELRALALDEPLEQAHVLWSLDGASIAIGSRKYADAAPRDAPGVAIVDARELRVLRRFGGHLTDAIAWSHDGAALATNEAGRGLRLWNVADGALLRETREVQPFLRAMAFSPDGARIAVGGADGAVAILDTRSLTRVARFEGHSDYVSALTWQDEHEQLVSCSGDGLLQIWETAPLRSRVAARARRAARMPELERRVRELRASGADLARIDAVLVNDSALDDFERRLARQIALREALAEHAEM